MQYENPNNEITAFDLAKFSDSLNLENKIEIINHPNEYQVMSRKGAVPTCKARKDLDYVPKINLDSKPFHEFHLRLMVLT